MLRIIVKGDAIEEKSGEKAGRKWVIREQAAFIETAEEKRKIKITLKDGAVPYKAGTYDIGEESFFVDQFGALGLRRLVLVPVAVSARAHG